MITDHVLTKAIKLLATFNEAYAYKRAHNPQPLRDWMREAKPIAGLDLTSRPLPTLVYYMVKERVEKRQMHDQEARASELPPPPAEIVITLPPVPAAFVDATILANRKAGRSPMNETVTMLRQEEAKLRAKATRIASLVGMTEEVLELLDIAAHLLQAAEIMDDPAGYDDKPFQI
jgi:hypothetical protein